ncbi:glycosyltransferase [Novipirellula artificiosorum]|uniref:Putative glycosyltransferase EpsJ n=1 Tax=Novipirellula artificiosorum TaxID=2528016 RepID=A0A5C6DLC7_9BACT|nr:glycosyltransferase [Novipirellula artificiosorum]TWU37412.1 putative glycosyltransferase EpsJ [Novipirellula artificiosorum]
MHAHSSSGSICIVTHSLLGVLSAKGNESHAWQLSHTLADQGWTVHLLAASDDDSELQRTECRRRFAENGISLFTMDDFRSNPDVKLDADCLAPIDAVSVQIFEALKALNHEHAYDLIQFAERGGHGFRTVQARRMGSAFDQTKVIVRLQGSSQWARHANRQWPTGIDEAFSDFYERYLFEHADFQQASSQSLLDHARSVGWSVRAEATVLPINMATDSEHVLKAPHHVGSQRSDSTLCDLYAAMISSHDESSIASVSLKVAPPLVSIAVPYYNMAEFAPDTLASLAAQDYPNLDVMVINDGSPDARSNQVFEQFKQTYPDFRFLSHKNRGLGATRNRGIAEARGEYFIPVDSDNIAGPKMVSRFVQAIERNPELTAVACFYRAFQETPDIAAGKIQYVYRPCGGPFVVSGLRNVYGDANAIFRLDAIRDSGGYELDRDTSYEDWEFFVKLACQGHQLDVIPEYLFYYRHREDSLMRSTDHYLNQYRVMRQFFDVNNLCRAEQITLWSTLMGLHEARNNIAPPQAKAKKTTAKRVMDEFQRVARKLSKAGQAFSRSPSSDHKRAA